jgi:alpha-tubulin suppressor-like RCC1 family protein
MCLLLQAATVGAQPVTAIAASLMHSLFLKSDGSLWAMGSSQYGQLGDGTNGRTNRPEQIVAGGVTAIAGGGAANTSLFLRSDGSLWGMGFNESGQLGDGTYSNTNFPEQIVASNVTAIATGRWHSLFLTSGGRLWAMGSNQYGELGDGTYNPFPNSPEEIVASGVTAIAAGGYHSLFIKSDGSLWAMGTSGDGQLGYGTYSNTNVPVQIVASNVTAIAAGDKYSLFVKSDGSLWAMGNDWSGQLGDGTNTDIFWPGPCVPEQIVAGGVTAVAAGECHSLFLKSDGSLWGMGCFGALSDSTNTSPNRPGQIVASDVTAISVGSSHCLFLKSDGSLWGVGDNGYGQLGDGTYTSSGRPKQIVAGPPPGYNRIFDQLLNGGSLRLSFVGIAGTNYALDRSFSLLPAHWVPQITNHADALGVLMLTNTPDPNTNNFWRIRLVP